MALYILTGCSGPKSSGADSPFVVSTNSKGTSSSTDDAVHRRVEELGTCREPEPKTAASLNHRSRQNWMPAANAPRMPSKLRALFI